MGLLPLLEDVLVKDVLESRAESSDKDEGEDSKSFHFC